ncbi:MAG TPA: alpha/beta hydrolase [Gaiellaceae bacterium]|nr:alpha/beta hydrolase [Gaiellaceae bacterium]
MTRRHVVDVGFPLVVREWGEDGAPLVYWPGLTPFCALHLNEAGPVWSARYGFRVISISPPGVETDALPVEDYALPRLASLVVAVLDALGLERAAYVGYSWGASIGCHLGALHPGRLSALVLLDAGYDDVPDDGKSLEQRIEEARAAQAGFRFADRETFLAAAREGKRNWRPALEERALAGMREENGEFVVAASPDAAAAALHGVIVDPPTAQLLAVGRTGVPVLLVTSGERAGDEEGRAAVERFRRALPQAEVAHVEGSGHDLLADAPETTIRAVGEFVKKL